MKSIVVKNDAGMAFVGMFFGSVGTFITCGAIYMEANLGIGWIFLFAVTAMLPVCAWKLFDRRVQIRIYDTGISYRGWPIETLPWADIENIEIRSDEERKYVCVVPSPNSDFFDSLYGRRRFHVESDNAPCAKIDAFHFNVDFYEFSDSLLEFYAAARTA